MIPPRRVRSPQKSLPVQSKSKPQSNRTISMEQEIQNDKIVIEQPPNSGTIASLACSGNEPYLRRHYTSMNGPGLNRQIPTIIQPNSPTNTQLEFYHQLCDSRMDHAMRQYSIVYRSAPISAPRRNGYLGSNLHNHPYSVQREDHSSFTLHHVSDSNTIDQHLDDWKRVREHRGVQVYRHIIRSNDRKSTMMATGIVSGTLRHVMNGLYADTSMEARVQHQLLNKHFVDTSILHIDHKRTEKHPYQFSGLMWMSVNAPTVVKGRFRLCKNRDFVFFKKMGSFRDQNGEEIGFLIMHSIDHHSTMSDRNGSVAGLSVVGSVSSGRNDISPTARDRPETSTRGHVSVAMFFKQDPITETVTIFMHGDVSASGRLPLFLAERAFADAMISFANAMDAIYAKKLSALIHQSRYNHARRLSEAIGHERGNYKCSLCLNHVSSFEGPMDYYCRGCWQRTCRKCRVKRPIYCAHTCMKGENRGNGQVNCSSNSKRTVGPCEETFCIKCVASVQPSDVHLNALLIHQLNKQKKRKRSDEQQDSASGWRGGIGRWWQRMVSADQVSATNSTTVASGADQRYSFHTDYLHAMTSTDADTLNDLARRKRQRRATPSSSYQPWNRQTPHSNQENGDDCSSSSQFSQSLNGDGSSISAGSLSLESEKHQQRRLVRRPTGRRPFASALMGLDILETFQLRQQGHLTGNSGASFDDHRSVVSSSIGSFAHTDAVPISDSSKSETGDRFSRTMHSQSFVRALRQQPQPVQRRGPNAKCFKPQVSASKVRDDAYYESLLLQRLNASTHSNSSSYCSSSNAQSVLSLQQSNSNLPSYSRYGQGPSSKSFIFGSNISDVSH